MRRYTNEVRIPLIPQPHQKALEQVEALENAQINASLRVFRVMARVMLFVLQSCGKKYKKLNNL